MRKKHRVRRNKRYWVNLKRKIRKERKNWQRAGKNDRHHILPKCRGGSDDTNNIIRMDIRRHAAFHLLFGVMTFKEAGELLLRAHKMKENSDAGM